ncbi:INPP5B_F [Acanthosepion pharaonis]|uniref:INPP5B_F n=1 Tax=Acanthosepion pharaonis TaxID=158019 RepID=A0A812BTE6_ACAPH|nr:INPP5B_F [Sepia pharaonis]
MEAIPLVKSKLAEDENCIICVRAGLVDNWKHCPRYVVLVDRQEDYAIFVFNSTQVPCSPTSKLNVELALPIDKHFTYKQESDTALSITVPDKRLLFEISASQAQAICKELKRAKDILTHTVGFGLPSSFSWLDKYNNKKEPDDNPFETDVFDPLKYMNLQDSDKALKPTIIKDSPQDAVVDNPFANDIFDPLKTVPVRQSVKSKEGSDSSGIGSPVHRARTDARHRSNSPSAQGRKGSPSNRSRTRSPAHHLRTDSPPNKLKVNSELARSVDSLNGPGDFDSKKWDDLEIIQKQLGFVNTAEGMDVGLKPLTARECFVRHFMTEREAEYTYTETVKVFCGTWNVNGQSPSVSIHTWLAADPEPPDIYAIGFQELDLSKEAFFFSDSIKEVEWLNMVNNCLHPGAKYKKIKLIRLVGIMLIVYVRQELASFVYCVDSDFVATGIMGFLGNKGGVAVRMTIHNTSLCFISSHLAAHQDEFERRNQDYRDISSHLRFRQFVPNLTMDDHEIIFWIGDLNYRISDIDIVDVKKLIEHKMYNKLIQFDQLYRQLGHSDVFENFLEGEVNFKPTYKYNSGTDDWDSSEKSRIPAWCDRILWKGNCVCQNSYQSHNELKISDHKAVSAVFSVGLKVIDQEKSKKVYEDIMKRLDRIENEYLPQVKIDTTDFTFEDVKFYESQKQKLIVANIGQGPVEFEFIKKAQGSNFCKPWLKVSPYKAVLMPGDLQEIELEMQRPIREVPVAQLVDLEQPGSLKQVDIAATGGRLYAVPKEIWRLIDHLHKFGRTQEGLFQESGLIGEIQKIRDCLDTGMPETIPGSIHSVAGALILFLKCLPEPVIPYNVHQKCLEVCNNCKACKQVLSTIPEHHRTVFKYICAFLRELLEYSESNQLDVKTLASIFGRLFLRHSFDEEATSPVGAKKTEQMEIEKKRVAFITHFLLNEYDD